MTNVRVALLYLAILLPLLAVVSAYDAFLSTGVLNGLGGDSVAVMWLLPAGIFLLPFVVAAMLYFRVTQWVRRQGTTYRRGLRVHLARCGVLYLALLLASMSLYRQAQTDVVWPWTSFLLWSVITLAGALCGILLADLRVAAVGIAQETRTAPGLTSD